MFGSYITDAYKLAIIASLVTAVLSVAKLKQVKSVLTILHINVDMPRSCTEISERICVAAFFVRLVNHDVITTVGI